MPDYIVIGSGPAGSMAAQTLIEGGASVLMLDVGNTEHTYPSIIPDDSFLNLRLFDANQHRYFIGDSFEGIPIGQIAAGAQLTPPRKYVIRGASEYLPVSSPTFQAAESLAYGGLGSAWGAGCFVFSNTELQQSGFDPAEMSRAYNVIAGRIGISGKCDDAEKYTVRDIRHLMPPAHPDTNARLLIKSYHKYKNKLNNMGFTLGRPGLALLTQNKGDRQKTSYSDMDFYSDARQSVWRPWMTIDRLKKTKQFQYKPHAFVLQFYEKKDMVAINYINTQTGAIEQIACRKLILASGALGSARIVLRSFKQENPKTSLLCNPYHYIVCILPGRCGTATEEHRYSLAQLSLFYDPEASNTDVSMGSLYGYGSLMMFRILNEIPINLRDGRKLLKFIMPGMLIAGIHHPDASSRKKHIQLIRDTRSVTQDKLLIDYSLTDTEQKKIRKRNRAYKKALNILGCKALKTVDPGFGSSIHYAGTLPCSDNGGLFRSDKEGKLHETNNIYIADSSVFNYLPAKGITLTIMANAHRTALNSLK